MAGTFLFLRWNAERSSAAAMGTLAALGSFCGMVESASDASCNVLTVEVNSGVCAPGLVCADGKAEGSAVECGRDVEWVLIGNGGSDDAEDGKECVCSALSTMVGLVMSKGGSSSRDSGATSDIVGAVCTRAP